MSAKIIVAGLGHGGIAVAAILAQANYDVTVYEQKKREDLGYDWTDIFAPKALSVAGIPMPDSSKYEYKEDMTFFGPSERFGLRQHVPQNQLEIKLERKDIYEHLITHAEKCGVKIVYECKIISPKFFGNRVVGVETDKGDFYGDLVIDACGMRSPLRTNLPENFGIEKYPLRHEYITIYRGFYNIASDVEVDAKFKVCLFKDNKMGISWVASEDNHTDLLIGRFNDFDINEVNRFADILRETNPRLGTEILRGGKFVEIPVRQPLSLMVADGYAAIGDSAFMTVPLIGSGIANSLRAARILADAIFLDKNNSFSRETLWNYQYNFYKTLGSGLAPLAAAKLLMLKLTAQEVDYAFDSGLITEDNVTIGADFTSITSVKVDFFDLINKAKIVCNNSSLLKKLTATGGRISSVASICAVIPKRYNTERVKAWKSLYERSFKI